MANSPPISAQVRQQLEDFAEVEERDLLLKIEKTIEQTPLKYLFGDGPVHDQVVNTLILHVEVFVERIFDFAVSLDLGRPVEQVITDAVNRAVLLLYGLHGFFERFGLAHEAAQKFKALEGRNADLFLPNLIERLQSGLESKVNNAVPRLKREGGTSEQASEPDGELSAEAQAVIRKKLDAASAIVKSAVDGVADETTGLEEAARELEWKASVQSDPGLSSVNLPKGEEQTQSATAREPGGSSDSDTCELPAFAPEALRRIELSILTAGNTLQEELLACWSRYFPLGVSRVRAFEPELFFQPFCSYGAAIYDAFATELIASISDYVKYEKIINNALKTQVCNRLAPFGHEGEWQRFLFASWKLFDHPRHSELHRPAIEVVEAFDGVVPRHWHPFIQSLHKAISRRTVHWLVEWKKLQAEKNAKREQLDARTTADPEQLLKVFATSEPDTGIVMTPCDGAAIRVAAVESVIRAATPAAGGKNVARSAARSGRLSGRDLQIHDLVGGERFHTLANAEIMKDASVKKRLRVDFQLEPGDAAKSCLDRIRHAKGYPLSREIAEKRSSRK